MQVKTKDGYILESVIINSSRMLEPFNIVGLVTDIEIFEHLDLPYITGQVAMMDTFRLYDRLDFQGAEYCTIIIKQSEKSPPIEKRFVIDRLLTNKKANEQTDLLMFHIVEDVLFKSNMLNVNKAYTGKPQKIIESIAKQWLSKDIENICSDIFQDKIRLIVPNLTPLDAMSWVKSRTTTSKGFPTYLFSSFTTEKLIYADLKTLIDGNPINTKAPFIYGVTNTDLEVDAEFRHVAIKEYNLESTDDLYNIIADGLVGARHTFYSTHTAKGASHKFDVAKDVMENVLEGNDGTKAVAFANDFVFDDVPLQEYTSKNIYQISQSGAYDDATGRFRSYDEDTTESDHAKKIMAKALKSFLLKAPISIRIDGAGFIEGNNHYTTGNIVRILFLANRPNDDGAAKLDLKKSGDYLVYGAKHSFGGARYNIHLKCVKLTTFTDDSPMRVIG